VVFAASAVECVKLSDALAITTPWAEFQDLPLAAFQRSNGAVSVLDCWRVLPASVSAGIEQYLTLGKAGETRNSPVPVSVS